MKLAALLVAVPLVAVPLVASAQEAAAPAAQPQYAPPPQYSPPPEQYAPPPAQYPPPRYEPAQRPQGQRNAWYIGFGLGTANGTVEDGIGRSSFHDYFGSGAADVATYAGAFEVGMTLSPKLLGGVEWTLTETVAKVGGVGANLTIQGANGVLTFFPAERGFFVRGGLGLLTYSYKDAPVTDGVNVYFMTGEHFGANAMAGVGYAFWLGRSFNLTLNLEFSGQGYPADSSEALAPKSSAFWAAYMGCGWY
jgi:hypothetical protein